MISLSLTLSYMIVFGNVASTVVDTKLAILITGLGTAHLGSLSRRFNSIKPLIGASIRNWF